MHRIRTIAFIKSWSTTTYNVLYPFDSGRSVIKFMVTVKNGYAWESALIGIRGGTDRYVLTFICRYSAHLCI